MTELSLAVTEGLDNNQGLGCLHIVITAFTFGLWLLVLQFKTDFRSELLQVARELPKDDLNKLIAQARALAAFKGR